MTTEFDPTETDYEAVRLAIAAAGPQGNDPRAWGVRIAELVPQIAAMMRRPNQGDEDTATTPLVTARKVRQASVFTAEFVKFSDEELSNTHRLLVAFRSKTSDDKEVDGDGLEWLRTEPSWTRAGWVMQRMVRNLEAGQQCTVYKNVEAIPGNKKVRVLVHLDARPKSRQTEPRPVPQQAERAPVGGEAGGAVPPAAPPAESNPAITEGLNRLKAAQMIALRNYCVGRGWSDWLNPGPDHIDGVLLALTKIEKGEALA